MAVDEIKNAILKISRLLGFEFMIMKQDILVCQFALYTDRNFCCFVRIQYLFLH